MLTNSVQDATETFEISGCNYTLSYPNSGNAQKHIRNILEGTDYPALHQLWKFTPTVIVDIGANVGAATFCFRKRYPDTPIFCFEPSADNAMYLERNTRMLDRISVRPYGLYGSDLDVPLYHGKVQCLQHSIVQSPEVDSEDSERVHLHDALDALKGIVSGQAILKIDTEGCEVPILQRITPLLQHVDLIYLEYHHERQRRAIDGILSSYSVAAASCKFLHRGNMLYVSDRLVTEHPEVNCWGLTDI